MFQSFKEKTTFSKDRTSQTYSESSNRLLRRVRLMTLLFMISGSFNIALISLSSYWYFSGGPHNYVHVYRAADSNQEELQIASFSGKLDLILKYKSMRFDQLVVGLAQSDLVEDGFTKRDLALASLVAFHHYDLSRALGGFPSQRRLMIFADEGDEQSESIVIFPGLSDSQYERILSFIRTERWPLTAQGLFLHLLDMKQDESLKQAFFLTPEFYAVETLFSVANGSYSKDELLELLLDGDWQILADFSEEQRLSQNLSDLSLQNFLLSYLRRVSPQASVLILRSDPIFALKKLNDEEVKLFLTVLREDTQETRNYALEMLTSPRSDGVWMAAAERLYHWEGKALPLPYDHMEALQRFVPQDLLMEKLDLLTGIPQEKEKPKEAVIVKPVVNKPEPKLAELEKEVEKTPPKALGLRTHRVQSGDTLSGIASEYGVSIESLRQYNGIESDFIYKGVILEIPEN